LITSLLHFSLVIQKRLILLAFFVLFLPTPSFSFDTKDLDTKNLANNSYWKKLLHFRDGESEIDSTNFFISPKGKTNPQAELEATLAALYKGDDISCRFPARIRWLYGKIPDLEQKITYKKCTPLEELIKSYQASKAVLVFPTAHINSPASMFGHTLLRIDDKKGLPLTANAVNYAAETQETNGLIFAYMGIFGGYEGRYSIMPYYKKIKEYNALERRDIWEYTLNLNDEELVRMLTHLYELKDTFAYYYFVKENCSYNLLWLLDLARTGSDLVEDFNFKAIPIDTIKSVKKAGFIESSHFRPSKTKIIQRLIEKKEQATGSLKEVYSAELDIELLRLKRTKNKVNKKDYIKKLLTKLADRSKLDSTPKITIPAPVNPLLSHKSSRVSIGYSDQEEVELSIKPSYHDIYDLDKGFVSGAYINFFQFLFAKNKDESIRLKNLDLISINSYALRGSIFKPISWGVAVGTKEFRGKSNAKLTGEVGVSYALTDKIFSFFMLQPSMYYKDDLLLGMGPKVGVIASYDNYKIGAIAEKNFFNDFKNNFHAEIFSTISLTKNTALNLKIETDKVWQEVYTVALFYYL